MQNNTVLMDLSKSLAIGSSTLETIKSVEVAAFPRNYEVLYHYLCGDNAKVWDAVNQIIQKKGAIGQDDLDSIYELYFSPDPKSMHIDEAGAHVISEIVQVVALLDAAAGNTSQYSVQLNRAQADLDAAKTAEKLRTVVQKLISDTRAIEESNRALEKRLEISKSEIAALQINLEAARTESLTDPLTTLGNRKYYDQSIERMLADAVLRGTPLSLLVIDIDHFKRFNDTYGHLTGDQVLRLVALAIKNNVKGLDVACRYGGEEFAIILPETPIRPAITVAEHIRRAVMTKELVKRSTGENLGRITISIGVAVYAPGETAHTLYERADSCLYAAKRGGRNKVVCETDPEAANGL